MIGKILVALPIVLFVYFTVKIYLLRRKFIHIPGPPTKGILGFYLGNIAYSKNMFENKIATQIFSEW